MKKRSAFALSNTAITFFIVIFAILIAIPVIVLNKMKAEDDMAKASSEQSQLLKPANQSDLNNLRDMTDSNEQELKDLTSRVYAIENYLEQNGNVQNPNNTNNGGSYSCEVTGYADLNNNPVIPPEIGSENDFSGDVATGRKKIILTCGIVR